MLSINVLFAMKCSNGKHLSNVLNISFFELIVLPPCSVCSWTDRGWWRWWTLRCSRGKNLFCLEIYSVQDSLFHLFDDVAVWLKPRLLLTRVSFFQGSHVCFFFLNASKKKVIILCPFLFSFTVCQKLPWSKNSEVLTRQQEWFIFS